MPTHTSVMQTQAAPREERIRHFAPAPPGSFVVYYDLRTHQVVRHAIVGWGVREREEWRFRDGEPDDHVVCDYVEAMVAVPGAAETAFASDLYDADSEGREVFRTLGITWPGDATDWVKEMERDLGVFESIQSSRRPPASDMKERANPRGDVKKKTSRRLKRSKHA